jgi:hypothetical protein
MRKAVVCQNVTVEKNTADCWLGLGTSSPQPSFPLPALFHFNLFPVGKKGKFLVLKVIVET